jgi:antitoxin (DNA-binding transcriptional repressor) of toxin-antitoxin stability system
MIRNDSCNVGGTMRVTATKFKQNIDQILDSILSNGKPVEIEKKGQIIRLVPIKTKSKKSKLMNLEPHDTIVGDPESIIHIDWAKEWQEEKNL